MNGLRSGKGLYKDPEGNVYEGDFLNGKCHGFGYDYYLHGMLINLWPSRLTYSNKDVFEGLWRDDKKDGEGKMVYADGRVVEGEWREGKMILRKKK